MQSLEITVPTPPPHPPPPNSCSMPVPTPTPSTGRCSNSFHSKPAALRMVYYKRASTELPPLTRRAHRLLLKKIPAFDTRGHRLCYCHQRTWLVTTASKGSANANCQFMPSSVKNARYEMLTFRWDDFKYIYRNWLFFKRVEKFNWYHRRPTTSPLI